MSLEDLRLARAAVRLAKSLLPRLKRTASQELVDDLAELAEADLPPEDDDESPDVLRLPTPSQLIQAALLAAELTDDGDLAPKQRLKLLVMLRLIARAWLRRRAEALYDEIYSEEDEESDTPPTPAKEDEKRLRAFFLLLLRFLGVAFVAALMLLMGEGELSDEEEEAIGQALAEQKKYSDAFLAAVLAGAAWFDPARAEMYGSSVYGAGHAGVAAAAKKAGIFSGEFAEHFGDDAPCAGCVDRISQGVQPLGTLTPIGGVECRENCHCCILYVTDDGTEWMAGRGRLDEMVFGAEG